MLISDAGSKQLPNLTLAGWSINSCIGQWPSAKSKLKTADWLWQLYFSDSSIFLLKISPLSLSKLTWVRFTKASLGGGEKGGLTFIKLKCDPRSNNGGEKSKWTMNGSIKVFYIAINAMYSFYIDTDIAVLIFLIDEKEWQYIKLRGFQAKLLSWQISLCHPLLVIWKTKCILLWKPNFYLPSYSSEMAEWFFKRSHSYIAYWFIVHMIYCTHHGLIILGWKHALLCWHLGIE